MQPVIHVAGIGSPHGDDQVGWLVVESLAGLRLPGVVCARRADPLELLDDVGRCDLLLVVDAVQSGRVPGSLVLLAWPDASVELSRGRSTHGFGLGEVLTLAGSLGRRLPRVVLAGVEAGAAGPCQGLSQAVAAALPGIVEELAVWLTAAARGPLESDGGPGAFAGAGSPAADTEIRS